MKNFGGSGFHTAEVGCLALGWTLAGGGTVSPEPFLIAFRKCFCACERTC